MAPTQPQPFTPPVRQGNVPDASVRLGWLYALLFTALPISVMAWAWAVGTVNVPKWDDHALRGFLQVLEGETSPLGWLRQVVKQHNEHRIAYDRLLTWADYTSFGKLSFKRLMAYGDLNLLALVALFGVLLARYTRRWYLFLPPVVFFIVSLAQWENFYWALSSIQNFAIVFWSLACLYTLTHRPRPWLAIGLATAATLTSGNGFLVWPIGMVLLLARRRNKPLLPWCIAATVLIAGYFWDYSMPNTHPPTRGSFLELMGGCVAFLGAAIQALPTPQPYLFSILLGTLLLLGWGVALVRSVGQLRDKTGWTSLQAFGFGALAFMIGTAFVVVWGRFGYGREMLLTSRYRIYSLTLLTLTYTYWLSAYYKNRVVSPKMTWVLALGGLLVSGLLWWSAFRLDAHQAIALRRQMLTNMQYNWTYATHQPVSVVDATTRRLTDSAPAFYDATLPRFFAPATGAPFPVDTVFKTENDYVIRLGAGGMVGVAVPSLSHPDAGLNVVLRSAKRTYLYGAIPTPLIHWRVVLGLLPLYRSDQPIEVRIPANELDAGTYDLAVAEYGPNVPAGVVRPTNQLLTVAPHRIVTTRAKNW